MVKQIGAPIKHTRLPSKGDHFLHSFGQLSLEIYGSANGWRNMKKTLYSIYARLPNGSGQAASRLPDDPRGRGSPWYYIKYYTLAHPSGPPHSSQKALVLWAHHWKKPPCCLLYSYLRDQTLRHEEDRREIRQTNRLGAGERRPGCYTGGWSVNPLRQWRKRQKLRALDIALRLEVSERTVLAWEHGAFRPSSEGYAGLSEIMNLTELELRTQWLSWLMELKDAPRTWHDPSVPLPPTVGLREPV